MGLWKEAEMAATQGGGGSRPGDSPTLPVQLLVWLALLNAVVLYGVVAFLVARPVDELPAIPGGLFPGLGVFLGAAALLGARFLPGSASGDDGERPRFTAGVRPRQIVTWALDESVAVVGLVAALLEGNPTRVIPYVVAAAALLLWHRPKG